MRSGTQYRLSQNMNAFFNFQLFKPASSILLLPTSIFHFKKLRIEPATFRSRGRCAATVVFNNSLRKWCNNWFPWSVTPLLLLLLIPKSGSIVNFCFLPPNPISAQHLVCRTNKASGPIKGKVQPHPGLKNPHPPPRAPPCHPHLNHSFYALSCYIERGERPNPRQIATYEKFWWKFMTKKN